MAASYIEALLEPSGSGPDYRWNNAGPLGTPVTLEYKFLTALPNHSTGYGTGFSPFTAAQKTAARAIFARYEELCLIDFTETTGKGADLLLGRNTQQGSAGYAFYPDLYPSDDPVDGGAGGDVWLARNVPTNSAVHPGGAGWKALTHEIGHALGLKHPGPYGGSPGPYLPNATDTSQYTVMSYNYQPGLFFRSVTEKSSGGYSISYDYVMPSTPMLYDIAAIQYLYGQNMATRAGNTVYTFDPDEPFIKCIWDGGGVDTISVANFSRACTIRLAEGEFSSIRIPSDPLPRGYGSDSTVAYSGSNNLSIAFGVTIENATGGTGNDTLNGNGAANILVGNGGDDTLKGVGGNDTLNGGNGNDRLAGGTGDDTYKVNSTSDTVTEAANAGTDRVDSTAASYTLPANVENLTLTGAVAINGAGNGLDNVITGNGANNKLTGGAGNDTLNGGAGNDVLIGLAGADVLTGGAGADRFDFDAPVDTGVTEETSDVVTDFNHDQGDKIDLSTIDANIDAAGNNAFKFIGGEAFSGNSAGKLRFDAANQVLFGSIDADIDPEFSILVSDVTLMFGADFVL